MWPSCQDLQAHNDLQRQRGPWHHALWGWWSSNFGCLKSAGSLRRFPEPLASLHFPRFASVMMLLMRYGVHFWCGLPVLLAVDLGVSDLVCPRSKR